MHGYGTNCELRLDTSFADELRLDIRSATVIVEILCEAFHHDLLSAGHAEQSVAWYATQASKKQFLRYRGNEYTCDVVL